MLRTAFPRPRDDDPEDVAWALSTANALWQQDERADALVWLQRASQAAADTGEAFRSEELAHAARTLRVALEDEALGSLPPLSRPQVTPFPNKPQPPRTELRPPRNLPSPPSDLLDPWAEKTPTSPLAPDGNVVTSALPLDELRRNSKRPPPPPVVEEASSTSPTWRPDASPPQESPDTQPAAARTSEPPISLDRVAAFAEVAVDARRDLARLAKLTELAPNEEVSVTGLVLILDGVGHVQPAILDITAVTASADETVYAQGSLARGLALRIVAEEGPVKVATFGDEVIAFALAGLPQVRASLQASADRLQALAGAALGSLGERLDSDLRQTMLARFEVRVLDEGEELATAGRPMPGMAIVGAGILEVSHPAHAVEKLHPGELVFPAQVLGAGPAPATVRAGVGGALVLFANRALTQELLVTWPPLLEVLAGL